VLIDGLDINFEPDEEGCYRAVRMPGQEEKQLRKWIRSFTSNSREDTRNIIINPTKQVR
jgi:hypothetical protein